MRPEQSRRFSFWEEILMEKSKKSKEKDSKKPDSSFWRDEHMPHTCSSGHLFGGRYLTQKEVEIEQRVKKKT